MAWQRVNFLVLVREYINLRPLNISYIHFFSSVCIQLWHSVQTELPSGGSISSLSFSREITIHHSWKSTRTPNPILTSGEPRIAPQRCLDDGYHHSILSFFARARGNQRKSPEWATNPRKLSRPHVHTLRSKKLARGSDISCLRFYYSHFPMYTYLSCLVQPWGWTSFPRSSNGLGFSSRFPELSRVLPFPWPSFNHVKKLEDHETIFVLSWPEAQRRVASDHLRHRNRYLFVTFLLAENCLIRMTFVRAKYLLESK